MKKILCLIFISFFFCFESDVYSHPSRALNKERLQKTIGTSSTVVTSNIDGYWFISTDAKIYMNSEGNVASTNYGILSANSNIWNYPDKTVGATGWQFMSDSGTANVTIRVFGD